MKFQAKIAYAERVEPLFNYFQSGLFLCDEQHALTRIQRVTYNICYSLTFTRSRRTVQNERRALLRKVDSFPLRRIG